jgi:hypothetical protein
MLSVFKAGRGNLFEPIPMDQRKKTRAAAALSPSAAASPFGQLRLR